MINRALASLLTLVMALVGVTLSTPALQPIAAQTLQASGPQTQPAGNSPQDVVARLDQLRKDYGDLERRASYADLARTAEEGVRLSRTLNDKVQVGRWLNNLGMAYAYLSRVEEALGFLKEAAAAIADTNNKLGHASILNNTAVILAYRLGRYEEALDCYTRSLSLTREIKNPSAEARTVRNIGVLYLELGEEDKAEKWYQEALRLARDIKDKLMEQAALTSLGMLDFERRSFRSALSQFEQALALDPTDARALPVLLTNIGSVHSELGDDQKAIEFFQRAFSSPGVDANLKEKAILLGNIGWSQHRLGRQGEALASLNGARAVVRQAGYLPSIEWPIDSHIGAVQRTLGHSEEALAAYREAIALIEKLRVNAPATDTSRASLIAARHSLFLNTIDLLFSLNRGAEALEIAERYHARSFLDLLAESKIDLRHNSSKEQNEREDSVFERISSVQKQLWKEGLSKEREAQLRKDLAGAESDLESFYLELRRTNPRYASVHYAEPLGVEQVQRELLHADSALVEYVFGEKRSFAWVVSQKKLTLAVLPPRKEIEHNIEAYRRSLTQKVSALTVGSALDQFSVRSRQIYNLLFQPLEAALTSIRRVTIVPDGVLAYVPFETLSGDAPHQQSLLERFAISYAPSASALASIRTRSGGVALRSKEFIGFADPVYDRPGKTEGERSTTQPVTHHAALESELERGFDLTNLPYTRTEVSNIRSLFPVARRQIYLGSEAREEKVKAEKLDDYRYVHFAAHGYIDEQHPRRSGIVLSLNGNEKEDGFLQMHEIMRLKLNADLVTLSACRTGVGTLFRGEGVLGLSRAFFYAGAASVVVSLWNVNDAATAELMKSFYQNLGRGMPKDEALRQAKLALLKSPQRTWHHPYYWAPFVLVGEPN